MDTSKTLVSFIFVYLAAVLHVSHEAFHRKSSHRKVEDVYYQPTPSLEPSMEIFNYEEFCREVYSPTMASHGQVKSLLPLFYLFGGYFLLNAFLCVASLTCSSTITSYSTESTTYSTTLIESTTSLTTTSIIESTTIATTSSSTTLATLTSTTTSVETSLFFTTTTTSTTRLFRLLDQKVHVFARLRFSTSYKYFWIPLPVQYCNFRFLR